MSVPEGMRKNTHLEVLVKAMELCTYTNKITANEKVFLPDYRKSVTDRIVSTAMDVYMKAWVANCIRVGNSEEKYRLRKSLQEESIRSTVELLALVALAKRQFHLRTKRAEYWYKSVKEVQTLLKKWYAADLKRYG